MAQQRISFEWLIEESQFDAWRSGVDDTESWSLSLSTAERIWANRIVRSLSLFMIVVCAAAGGALTPAERDRLVAQGGIQFSLDQENRAWRSRDRRLFESLIDPTLNEDWSDEWREYWRAGIDDEPAYNAELIYVRNINGLMQATVVTDQPAYEWWQTNPYRENRFYRRAGQGWLRTVPPSGYWGDRHSLETEHLRFVFYAKDAATVANAADRLEAAYVEMYTLLGLDAPSTETKLTVSVVNHPVGRWAPSPTELEVTSPLLSQIPQGQSDAEYLAYDIMGWFTYRALRDANPGSAGRYLYRWPILIWGLRGWLRDDLLDQSSPWRQEASRVFEDYGQDQLPLRLSNVSELRGDGRPTREQVIMRYIAAESFIRFAVETYGRDQLPELLRGLVRHGTWDELIPSVYGHSPEKFVADWNVHLLEYYGALVEQ
jgi:hypothetical protein